MIVVMIVVSQGIYKIVRCTRARGERKVRWRIRVAVGTARTYRKYPAISSIRLCKWIVVVVVVMGSIYSMYNTGQIVNVGGSGPVPCLDVASRDSSDCGVAWCPLHARVDRVLLKPGHNLFLLGGSVVTGPFVGAVTRTRLLRSGTVALLECPAITRDVCIIKESRTSIMPLLLGKSGCRIAKCRLD